MYGASDSQDKPSKGKKGKKEKRDRKKEREREEELASKMPPSHPTTDVSSALLVSLLALGFILAHMHLCVCWCVGLHMWLGDGGGGLEEEQFVVPFIHPVTSKADSPLRLLVLCLWTAAQEDGCAARLPGRAGLLPAPLPAGGPQLAALLLGQRH